MVTDILSSEWTLDPASFLVDGAAPAPEDVTVVGDTITWNVGAITSTAKTLSYVISGDAPYYGIVDTNDSAKLEFTPVLGAASPTASPVFFPVPEAMLSAFAADDERTVAWNGAVSFDVRSNDAALNTRIDQGGGSYVPAFTAFVPVIPDPLALTYSRAGVSGTLAMNPDGTFTYTPDGSVLATGYDVSFPYYLVGVDSAFRSEPATVTIHVTPTGTTSLQIEKINEGGLATDSFTFSVRINGELYTGPATIGATPATIVDGILNLTGGQIATISGLLPGTPYSVAETPAIGYSQSYTEGTVGTISLEGSLASFTNYADNGQLTIYKSVYDANGQDVTDQELVFPILITGPSYPSGLATTVTSGIPLVLTGLAFGDYTVVETDDSGLYDASIGSEGVTVNLNVEITSDSIYITNTEIASPNLTVVKVAQNLTTGGDPVDGTIVDAVIGDVVRYTVTVTNPGNMTLTDAVLSDDLVAIGSAVSVDGVPTVWMDGGAGNDPYIDLGTLDVDDVVIVTYDYTITAADATIGLRTNTASIEAVATYPMLLQYTFAVRDEFMLPETRLLSDSDDAMVLADEIPLNGTPSVSLTKSVRNKTLSGIFGDAAGGLAGDVFEYRIIVMNNGTLALSSVMVHDNRAVVGSAVTVNGVAKTWTAGTDGKAAVNIGDLAIGAIATLTYDYTSVAADIGTSLVNTAIADGTVTVTIPNPVPTRISSLGDTALALVEERIPETGESVGKELIAGATRFGYRCDRNHIAPGT